MIVVDTHIFIWYALDDPNLPKQIRAELEAKVDQVYVPSVCFWEAMILAEKGRISLGEGHPDSRLRSFLEISGFNEAPLTSEIAMLSRSLQFEHNDPADRFIAATAYAMNARLATADASLRALPWVQLAF